MASLSEIKAGLKARFQAYLPNDVRCYAEDPMNPQVPAVWIYGPTEGTVYDQDFDGDTVWRLEAIVGLSAADMTRAQDAMNAYLSPTGARSLRAAVRADETLGGTVDYARVVGVGESPRLADAAGSQLLRASVRVEARG